ncbi:hypothetical protein HPB49_010814 [Dermacentor silvarum]|uniref:Uncharacterized protein n=1 Tax=Dermacentor silvarum TaxID=543639 RepID=A0ACB8CEN0_DERSI|nr:hypothetical protein HPB49_010814 [Dermacentor silvarum]
MKHDVVAGFGQTPVVSDEAFGNTLPELNFTVSRVVECPVLHRTEDGPHYDLRPLAWKENENSTNKPVKAQAWLTQGLGTCPCWSSTENHTDTEGKTLLLIQQQCSRRLNLPSAVSFLRDNDLKLIQADKEGGFVVGDSGTYRQLAQKAFRDNFKSAVNFRPTKAKKLAIESCENAELTTLAVTLKSSKELCLSAIFAAKTHKEGTLVRVIVSESGTWQRWLGSYLLNCLSLLEVKDPFLVRSPSEVSLYLTKSCHPGLFAFSVDIKDMFYSLPQDDPPPWYRRASMNMASCASRMPSAPVLPIF